MSCFVFSWFDQSTGTGTAKVNMAIATIKQYYAFMLNAVRNSLILSVLLLLHSLHGRWCLY